MADADRRAVYGDEAASICGCAHTEGEHRTGTCRACECAAFEVSRDAWLVRRRVRQEIDRELPDGPLVGASWGERPRWCRWCRARLIRTSGGGVLCDTCDLPEGQT